VLSCKNCYQRRICNTRRNLTRWEKLSTRKDFDAEIVWFVRPVIRMQILKLTAITSVKNKDNFNRIFNRHEMVG